mgnify:CR=1 FL=1
MRFSSLWAALLTLALALAACSPPRSTRLPDVVLVSIDTLRADHVGAYGYGPPTTPELDRFAGDSVLFENTISHAPSTLPSHASLFTSRLPMEHRVLLATRTSLPPDMPVLAGILAEAGYRTAGFHSGGQLRNDLGIGTGFEIWEQVSIEFAPVVDRGCRWLAESRERPSFLFLHTYEIHHPYEPDPEMLSLFEDDYAGPLPDHIEVDAHLRKINDPSDSRLEIDEHDLAHIVATYDAELRSADEALGKLFRCLRSQARYEDALVIVTSDHGEEFGEHGMVGWHSHTLFDELLRVPLVTKLPGGRHAGTRVATTASLIDLAPTILRVAGLSPPASFRGTSLLPPMASMSGSTKREEDEVVISMRDVEGLAPSAISARSDRFKLIGDWLFDLVEDPGETKDVASAHPTIVERLARERSTAVSLARQIDEGSAAARDSLSPETISELRALGYVD